jgi:hypothetical protein
VNHCNRHSIKRDFSDTPRRQALHLATSGNLSYTFWQATQHSPTALAQARTRAYLLLCVIRSGASGRIVNVAGQQFAMIAQ